MATVTTAISQLERVRANADLYARAGLAVLGLSVFLALVLRLSGWPVLVPDAVVFDVDRGPAADVLMELAARISGEEAMALGTAALMTGLIYRRAVRAAVFVGVGLTLGNLGSAVLKWTFDRTRPPIDYQPSLVLPGWTDEALIGLALLILVVSWPTKWRRHGLLLAGLTALLQGIDVAGETIFIDQKLGSSFPSGHAMRSAAWAVSLVLISRLTPWRRWVLLGTAAFVLVVGVSRVYLGVHYPSDVLAGWAIAIAAVLAVSLIPRLDPQRADAAAGDGSELRVAQPAARIGSGATSAPSGPTSSSPSARRPRRRFLDPRR